MFYLKRHNQKIAVRWSPATPGVLHNVGQYEHNSMTGASLDLSTSQKYFDVSMSEANASKMDTEDYQERMKVTRPSYSHTSRGSSTRATPDEAFRYPKMPVAKEDFPLSAPCPLYSQPLNMRSLNRERWRYQLHSYHKSKWLADS
jgi:hypothetical protein